MDMVLLLKLVHIAAAIVAVGANVSYGFWLAIAGRDRERLVFSINGIRRLDTWIANPAYIVLLVTGVLMVLGGLYPLNTFWIVAALVLYAVTAIVGIAVYSPALKRQLREAEADPSSAAYAAAARRSNLVGVVTVAIVALILVLMVFKPGWPTA